MLLIDEVDRADDEFEAFLLEILSDYPVTVPELGTFRADVPPVVVLTSNRTRDVHDALKRRCLYHWVEHPDFEREVAIVRLRAPEVGRAAWPARSPPSVEALREPRPLQAARAWPRPSTGPRPSPRSARADLDEATVGATLGTVAEVPRGPGAGPATTASASSSIRRAGPARCRDAEVAAGARAGRPSALRAGCCAGPGWTSPSAAS